MAVTPNLNLLKKDPVVNANDTFNIVTMLNDNWDKIDDAVGNINKNKLSKGCTWGDIKNVPQGK